MLPAIRHTCGSWAATKPDRTPRRILSRGGTQLMEDLNAERSITTRMPNTGAIHLRDWIRKQCPRKPVMPSFRRTGRHLLQRSYCKNSILHHAQLRFSYPRHAIFRNDLTGEAILDTRSAVDSSDIRSSHLLRRSADPTASSHADGQPS